MDGWTVVRETLASEFADLGNLEQLTRMLLRLLTAGVLGGILGLQRERRGKEAGIRTHMLLAMGSAVFVVGPVQMGFNDEALSRVLQGLVSGVGLLCAGSILKLADADRVRGLTTAAGLWLTAAIGMAAGMGREVTALACTLLGLAVLALEGPLTRIGLRTEDEPPHREDHGGSGRP